MTVTRRQVLVLGAYGATALVARSARADETGDLFAKVAQARASLKTLRGPFTQTRTIGLLATEVRSTGTFTLVRPDRLRWELAPPDDIVYWVGPEGLAYKSKTGEGRMIGGGHKIAAALEDLRAVLGGDLGALRKRYDVNGQSLADGGARFTAVPKSDGPGMRKIELTLASDLVRPTRATLYETAKDRVQIVFGPLERDVPIDPAIMKPPS